MPTHLRLDVTATMSISTTTNSSQMTLPNHSHMIRFLFTCKEKESTKVDFQQLLPENLSHFDPPSSSDSSHLNYKCITTGGSQTSTMQNRRCSLPGDVTLCSVSHTNARPMMYVSRITSHHCSSSQHLRLQIVAN